MAHRMACESMRRVDRILQNGVFTGKFNIFPQIQPTFLQSRQFLDVPNFDPPQGFNKPVDLKDSTKSHASDAAVDVGGGGSGGGSGGGGGNKTKSSGGDARTVKFTKITMEHFINNYVWKRNTKTSTLFLEQVEFLPGEASEDGGKIFWFEIDDTGSGSGMGPKNDIRICGAISIVGILGVCWVYLNSRQFNWKGFVDGFMGRRTSDNNQMGINEKPEHRFAVMSDISILTMVPVIIYLHKRGPGALLRKFYFAKFCLAIGVCFAAFDALKTMAGRFQRGVESGHKKGPH